MNVTNKNPKALCPTDECDINTSKPFRHYQHFEAQGDKVVAIHNKFVQGSKVYKFESCNDEAYIESMTDAFKSGMVMTFSLWGEDHQMMNWLDGGSGCTGACNKQTAQVTFSNIKFEKKTMLQHSQYLQ